MAESPSNTLIKQILETPTSDQAVLPRRQATYISPLWFITEPLFILAVIILPLSVQAGVFSKSSNTSGETATPEVFYTQDANMQTISLLKAAQNIDPNPNRGGGDIIVDNGVLVPNGDINHTTEKNNTKTSNGEISVYVVRDADTLSQIAEMFDVSAKTILWANDISDPSTIHPGESLVILPITGVRHVVKKGDTIKSIAKKYEGDVDDILAYNQLSSSDEINIGDTVVIPGGKVHAPAPTTSKTAVRSGGSVVSTGGGSAGFVHPVPGAVRSQGIHGYNGVDFAAPAGTPVLAAASGEVIVARASGWNGGYGIYVVVKHPNGTQTLYAHLSRAAVSIGTKVSAGSVVGYMGSTGRSTGNHLHFEVRGARNPF